jgi:hypothetical protein
VPLSLIAYIALAVLAVVVGGIALISVAQRREVLARAGAIDEAATATALRPVKDGPSGGIRGWVTEMLATQGVDDSSTQEKLIQAGFESRSAPASYFMVRVAVFVLLPLGTFLAVALFSLF